MPRRLKYRGLLLCDLCGGSLAKGDVLGGICPACRKDPQESETAPRLPRRREQEARGGRNFRRSGLPR